MPRHLTAGVAALLLLAWLATPAAGQLTDGDGNDDELVDGVDDVVDVESEDDPSESEQEAADEGEPQEVSPEPEPEGEPQPQPEPEPEQGAAQEPADGPTVPSGPQRAAGPSLRAGGGAAPGSAYDAPPEGGIFDPAEPEVFDGEAPGSHEADEADEAAVTMLHDQRARRDLGPAEVPRELVAASTALVVLLGTAHALHATRRIDT